MADFGSNLIKNIIRTLVMAPVYTTAGYVAYRTGRCSKEARRWEGQKVNDQSPNFWPW
ncbi:hypothetical protein H5410_000486 [Solanum commersonii]|uniref:Uncharacterized protein n=1 Tax=Solanum commersonii TaxID=4109 RepID=A0A9J6AWM3_SOLCO|nr:hypothetical protein H5410_000486 [Solanum commersonii]